MTDDTLTAAVARLRNLQPVLDGDTDMSEVRNDDVRLVLAALEAAQVDAKPAPSAEPDWRQRAVRAEAERDALRECVKAADAMYASADHTGGNPGCNKCDAADDFLAARAKVKL